VAGDKLQLKVSVIRRLEERKQEKHVLFRTLSEGKKTTVREKRGRRPSRERCSEELSILRRKSW